MREIWFATCLAMLGCGEVSSASELDHAQILAVRASPPRLLPGSRAKIDALAALDDGTVLEMTEPALDGELAEGSWIVVPPIAVAEPFPVTVGVSVELDGEIKRAEKRVYVGAAGENPVIDQLLVDDAPIGEEPVVIAIGSEPKFSAAASGEGELSFAWHSSVGKLGDYRSAAMELFADAAAEGAIICVVRDPLGGTAWRILPVSVR